MLADSLYLENINEYVQDENKIVTYKWLSRKLDVPVNAAKQMLYSYVSQNRGKKTDGRAPMTVTYVVSGLIGDKEHQVHLIPEDELEATKQQLNQILGVHVYSVQKNDVKETECLYTANQHVSKEHLHDYSKWSPIESPCPPQIIKASSSSRTHFTEDRPSSRDEEKHDSAIEKAKPSTLNSEVKSKSSLKTEITESKPENKMSLLPKKSSSKKKPSDKGTLSSMFAKQARTEKAVKQASPTSPKNQPLASSKQEPTLDSGKEPLTSPKKESKTTIVHLVSPQKSPSKSPRKQVRSSVLSKSTKLSISVGQSKSFSGLGDSDIEDDESEGEGQSSSSHTRTTETQKTKKSRKVLTSKDSTKPLTTEVKQSETTQKRKRKRVQDLSSDEEESTTPVVKKPWKGKDSTCDITGGCKRRRVKKMVRKMYTNDDGEMVTERVYESASTDASAEENNEEQNEDDIRSENSSVDPMVKEEKLFKPGTKQSSIMSFFLKK